MLQCDRAILLHVERELETLDEEFCNVKLYLDFALGILVRTFCSADREVG